MTMESGGAKDDAMKTADATEHGTLTPLAELVSNEVGQTGEWNMRVFRSDIVEYQYAWKGKNVSARKLQLILLSTWPEQYCLAIAKQKQSNTKELDALKDKYCPNTTWKLSNVVLFTSEKSQYIHTSCRIAIDIRNTKIAPMLQSTSFPTMPAPATTIASVLQLRKQQRFDLMAIPSNILDKRHSGAGQIIADVRLIDDSKNPADNACKSAMPLTLFFKGETEFSEFQKHVGRLPLLFTCLNGFVDERGKVNIATVKNLTHWIPAKGNRATELCDAATQLCDAATEGFAMDVVSLPAWTPSEAVDYKNCPATLSAVSIVDTRNNSAGILGELETEHLYQLNHVYVPTSASNHSVLLDGRLFAVFDCWDYSKLVQFGFRSQAMLQLAGFEAGTALNDYQVALDAGEIRHPILASLRVRIKRNPHTQTETAAEATEPGEDASPKRAVRDFQALVVEAEPYTHNDSHGIPNDAIDGILGVLAAGAPLTSERLLAVALADLAPSPFYNMTVQGEPVEKAIVFLHFTQRSNGAATGQGFRVITDNVTDAVNTGNESKFRTIARCTVERSPDFIAAKKSFAIAIVSKVLAPSKEAHVADLYIETIETVDAKDAPNVGTMMEKLTKVGAVSLPAPSASKEEAWEQRKCRRLGRYPTMTA